jgi:hypothetical protein
LRIHYSNIVKLLVILAWGFASLISAKGTLPKEEAAKLLPDQIAVFRASAPATAPGPGSSLELAPENFGAISEATRTYTSDKGHQFVVVTCTTQIDSGAYALLARSRALHDVIQLDSVGTASITGPQSVFFTKGNTYVQVWQVDKKTFYADELISLAKALAEKLDKGDGDIPSVIKHLPDWQRVQPQTAYALSLETLKGFVPDEPVLDAVSFTGGAEAAVAHYDAGDLVIIEFTTPQLATVNDAQISAKLQELRGITQPVSAVRVPTAYRRVGNYAVFVFNGQSEQAANQLIDQIKYEQVVRWLGNNPYAFEEAQKKYVDTTLGVLVSVVKGSGLALLTCLAVGGFFGALLFVRRRSQQRAIHVYSDAGGMSRLNLDDLTPQTDPSRLIGPGH